MNKSYKYILFDWDGTLAKTLDVWLDAYKEICGVYNIDISKFDDREVVEIFFGKQGEGYKKFGVEDVDTAYELVKKIVDDKVANVSSYENSAEVLGQLDLKGIKMALHTTSNRNLLYPAIKNLDFEKYFKIILTKDDVQNPKPDPEVVLKELKFLNAKADETVIVGDSDKDIITGKNAGIDTVLFYPESHKKFYREEFLTKEKPTYIIHNLLDLLEIVH